MHIVGNSALSVLPVVVVLYCFDQLSCNYISPEFPSLPPSWLGSATRNIGAKDRVQKQKQSNRHYTLKVCERCLSHCSSHRMSLICGLIFYVLAVVRRQLLQFHLDLLHQLPQSPGQKIMKFCGSNKYVISNYFEWISIPKFSLTQGLSGLTQRLKFKANVLIIIHCLLSIMLHKVHRGGPQYYPKYGHNIFIDNQCFY